MKQLYALLFILLAAAASLTACATPEATLVRGYQTVSTVAKATTVLVDRDAITVKDAEHALALGTTSKGILDSGRDALKQCRATPGAKCDSAVSNINLGAGVLLELENYLKANQ